MDIESMNELGLLRLIAKNTTPDYIKIKELEQKIEELKYNSSAERNNNLESRMRGEKEYYEERFRRAFQCGACSNIVDGKSYVEKDDRRINSYKVYCSDECLLKAATDKIERELNEGVK